MEMERWTAGRGLIAKPTSTTICRTKQTSSPVHAIFGQPLIYESGLSCHKLLSVTRLIGARRRSQHDTTEITTHKR